MLGYVENGPDDKWKSPGVVNKVPARALLERFSTSDQVDDAMAELRRYWDGLLATYTASTGNERVDRMVNFWNPYQCMVTFNMSRKCLLLRVRDRPRHGSVSPTRTCSDSSTSSPTGAWSESSTPQPPSFPTAAPTTSTNR